MNGQLTFQGAAQTFQKAYIAPAERVNLFHHITTVMAKTTGTPGLPSLPSSSLSSRKRASVDNFREQAKRLRTTGATRSAVKALIGGYISPQEGSKSSHTPPDAEYSSDGDASDYRTDVDHESGSDEEDNHVEDELEENETRLRKALSKGRKGSEAPARALAGKMAMLASKSSRGNLKEVSYHM